MYKVIASPMWQGGTGQTQYDETAKKMRIIKGSAKLLGYVLLLTDEKNIVTAKPINIIPQTKEQAEVQADFLNNYALPVAPNFTGKSSQPHYNLADWLIEQLQTHNQLEKVHQV